MLKKEKSTETISVRLSGELLKKIRKFASAENVNLNSFISQLLIHAVEWDILAAKAGWVPFPKKNLIAILNEFDETKIIELATRLAKNVPKELLMTMRGKYDLEGWLSVLNRRAKASGFSYNQISDNDMIQVIVRHDMGYKWSLWFKTFYSVVFSDLGYGVDFETTEDIISYTIYLKKNKHQ